MELPQQVNQFILYGRFFVCHVIRTSTGCVRLPIKIRMINPYVLVQESFLLPDKATVVEHSARRRQVLGIRDLHELVPIMPPDEGYHTVELTVFEVLHVHKVQRRAIGIFDGVEQGLLLVGIVGFHEYHLLLMLLTE